MDKANRARSAAAAAYRSSRGTTRNRSSLDPPQQAKHLQHKTVAAAAVGRPVPLSVEGRSQQAVVADVKSISNCGCYCTCSGCRTCSGSCVESCQSSTKMVPLSSSWASSMRSVASPTAQPAGQCRGMCNAQQVRVAAAGSMQCQSASSSSSSCIRASAHGLCTSAAVTSTI